MKMIYTVIIPSLAIIMILAIATKAQDRPDWLSPPTPVGAGVLPPTLGAGGGSDMQGKNVNKKAKRQRITNDNSQRITIDSLQEVIKQKEDDRKQREVVDSLKHRLEEQNQKNQETYTYKLQTCTMDYERVIGLGVDPLEATIKTVISRLSNEEKLKACYSVTTRSDTTLVYSFGTQSRVTTGYIYDNFGNKLETTEKELVGIRLEVLGNRAKFDYTENKVLALSNQFDSQGEMQFRAEYWKHEKKCKLFVLCDFTEKKQLVLMGVTREKVR